MSADYLRACTGCGTPTVRWRGTVHGYTCDRCMTARIGLDRPPTRQQRRNAHYIEQGHPKESNR
ncbi:hypothetical protein [Gordonia malaquae]|uniref:hypothetical protein n=1 Tax=Gordonia malaquae TaxID=410332 RepID=UPI0030FEA620